MKVRYDLNDTADIISPALIYYYDILEKNIEKAISIAGGAKRLWPHVKSHKAAEMVKLQIRHGITKFKTATIAEAEMAADAGGKEILLAYPLITPNIERYMKLAKAYPETVFYAVGENQKQFQELSDCCMGYDHSMPCLVDVNMGMNRTGAAIEDLEELYRRAAMLPGIRMAGMHCYDGNHNDRDFTTRNAEVSAKDQKVMQVMSRLREEGLSCSLVVAGGTPSFPCHSGNTDWYLSPGTALIMDAGYYKNLPDLDFIPGAAILTRVISHPAKGMFTIDLGYKGIASDPPAQRGYIIGLENAVPVIHSEEHWVFQMEEETRVPEIGTCLYVIPTHICPTSALYPEILVAKEGAVIDRWQVTARNRKITY